MTKPARAAKLTVKYLPTNKLVPYARNSRTHSPAQVAQIAASIREFGFTNPVLVDAADGIIAGHGRVLAAQMLELAEVPTIELTGLTEAQKRAYVIADNKLALNSGWDEKMLALEISDLSNEGYDLSMLGFSSVELQNLMDGEEHQAIETDGNESRSGSKTNKLSFGDVQIDITEDELTRLMTIYKSYTEEFGLNYGFVAWLLDGRNA